MTTPAQWGNLIGSTAVGADGDKIGKVGQIYLDDATGQPGWVAVRTGLFRTREASPRCTTPSPATERYGSS